MIDFTAFLEYNTQIVIAGTTLLGACAGMLGCFAVLRRKALTGDALAHAALPGLCMAFLILGERSLPEMLLGAFLSGLLGICVIAAINRFTRVKEDAAIGIVLSVFFGAGIVLSSWIQKMPTGQKAGLDSYILGKTAGMLLQDVELIGGASLVCLLAVLLLYKEFQLISFDTAFARVQGWPASFLDLLLMGMIAVGVVIGLPAVGVVMMSALLILPGVAARFWTDRLSRMLFLAAALGGLTGAVGTALSAQFSLLPAGPIIVLVGTCIFLISLFFAPRRGLVVRAWQRWRFRRELAMRNFLRGLWEMAEEHRSSEIHFTQEDLVHRFTPAALSRALRNGYLRLTNEDTYTLTEEGLHRAIEITRGYRLWQELLLQNPDQAPGLVTLQHETVADLLPAEQVAGLIAALQKRGEWPAFPGEARA
jgi:manganese/zinc/iron transport system permease protein